MLNNFKNNFIDRQFKHIRLFQNNMIMLEKNLDKLPFKLEEWELIRACLIHDYDKFNPNIVEKRVEISKYWYCKRYHIQNNTLISKEELEIISNQHYTNSRHHIEYYKDNNIDYMVFCEMASDMSAICQESDEKIYTNFLVENRKTKFKILSDFQVIILSYLLNLIKFLYVETNINKIISKIRNKN